MEPSRSARPRNRFSKRDRVRKRREYQSLSARGKRLSLPHFVFVIGTQPEPGNPRIGITASRKVGNAVVRNRAKRLIREAFRATRDIFPAGVDVVIIVKRLDEGMGLADVVQEFRGAARALQRKARDALIGAPHSNRP